MPSETKISFYDGGSSDAVRKLSDELSRKHLSDLLEAEEDEISSTIPERPRSQRKASTSSTFSVTSMDALWEKHPRRLSEAGLRRSSDHSVVLTEDTDSFIIGDRVWVGGTKPGQIAYIGETQFAPGEWAGIVLDDPIGKNDGSVAGTRYFQCSERRGVFSRLTRLTRTPLISHSTHDASPVSDAGSVFERPPSSAARQRRTLSPNGSIRSVVSSKMNASITTTTPGSREVGIGDRVIVSSSRGSKAGALRYVGVTDFAPGVWAGVELDDPLGKNDGSVDGKRYFECAPRFGLFAPISKVSRSPSNRKPGTCAIHSNGRATPLRRSNSRESLISLGTSIASSRITGVRPLGAQRLGGPRAVSTPVSAKNALQELLREKQSHLERLMRERELERADIAKITLQADRAETALSLTKKEVAQASTENEKLKTELDSLRKMLEDERQKVEDLMFRNEEENINKEDYQKYKAAMEAEKATHLQRIRELEAEVALESARAETSASTLKALEEQRVHEMTTISEQHKEELGAAQTLSTELQKLLDEAYALLKEKESEKDSLGKSMSEELSKLRGESERALNEAKTKLAIAQTEYDTQISVLTAKLQLAESKLETEKTNLERLNKENSQTLIDLNSKVSQLQAALDDKTHELNKLTGVGKEHELNMSKEITKLRMELSAKILELEQLTESSSKQETTCKNLQAEIVRVKEEYTSKINEYETMLNDVSQQCEKKQTEIIELQQNLVSKTKDYERLLNESSTTTSSTEKIITEYKETIHERDKEIVKLKDEFEKANANFNINQSKIAEEHKKEIDERNNKIDLLVKEIESHKLSLDKTKTEFEALNAQLTTNVDELKVLKEENEQLKKTIAELTQANAGYKEKISAMELEIGEHKRQFDSITEKCEELQKAKDKAEAEYMNLTGQATDSNEQFNKLSQHLKETEKELQDLKDKHREATNNHGRQEQEMKQKLFKLQEEYATERAQLIKTSDEHIDKIQALEQKIKDNETHLNEFKTSLRDNEANKDKLQDENANLKKDIEAQKVKEAELVTEHEALRKKLETDIEKYKHEIELLRAEGATSEVKLMEKVDQLIEAQNDLNNKLEESRRHEDALQKVIEDMTSTLNNQKAQYEKEISLVQSQLVNLTEESNSVKAEEARLKELLQEKTNNLKEVTLKLDILQVELDSNVKMAEEKSRQLAELNDELNKAVTSKKSLEEKLNKSTVEASTLKQMYENLIANSSAEESLVKDQQAQLETLMKDVALANEAKTNVETKCFQVTQELDKLKVEHEDVVKRLKDNVEVNATLQKSIEEKDKLLKTEGDRNESESNKAKTLDVELMQVKQELASKTALLEEREQNFNKLNEQLQTGANETQQTIKELQEKCTELTGKHKTEVETLNNACKELQNRVTEQEKQLEELQKAKETIIELQALLTKSDSDIKQLTNINEGQKSNYEDLNAQLKTQCDEYKKECKRIKHEMKSKLAEYEKELQSSKDNAQAEIEKQNQLQKKLSELEARLVEATNKLELASVQNSANVDKDSKLEELTIEVQALRKSSSDALQQNENLVKSLRSELEVKKKELEQKQEAAKKLQEELKNQKVKAELAERERLMLQKELSNKDIVKDRNDNSALASGDNKSQTMIEEAAMLDGQVSFLNSVIVDMQRKNEQLMARVQALEGGTPGDTTPVFNGRKPRAVAPRLFCDICDVFDAHDTEDCPRQAAGEPDPGPRKPAPAPRPYCDICEVFGHSTENCDEEETF